MQEAKEMDSTESGIISELVASSIPSDDEDEFADYDIVIAYEDNATLRKREVVTQFFDNVR
ncbi:uncharacterized protein Z520_02031 [Fonsecaea multimorphosa CBS 102226]|uniref:Uncharacterized protein n=1 Tax=Fonsecaea multimorphosa CBS 102226 TaxID=1442371 RepID=A0A0D2K7F3_9EURO|nr:uncharacterized protein Z520_02031 [Fonsecaea multimorphosa CBS 102226]KIY01893.1 hypothetical protein Z520_02031 [Fonsecaea multimorphosa CBS 102226]